MSLAVKSCLFDLDGTLLDTIPALHYTVSLTLNDLRLPKLERRFIPLFAGDGVGKLLERTLGQVTGQPPSAELLSRAQERYLFHFKTGCMHEVAPYPTMPELLQALKERGITLAVVTNKPQPMAEANIHGFFGEGLFDTIVGAREGLPRKPAPDAALLAARTLGTAPNDCLYIGDTNTDMRTGSAAGMRLCGALWGFRDRDELEAFRPDFLAERPIDILEHLK